MAKDAHLAVQSKLHPIENNVLLNEWAFRCRGGPSVLHPFWWVCIQMLSQIPLPILILAQLAKRVKIDKLNKIRWFFGNWDPSSIYALWNFVWTFHKGVWKMTGKGRSYFMGTIFWLSYVGSATALKLLSLILSIRNGSTETNEIIMKIAN